MTPMIVFKSVYRTFDPDESGLKDVSFSVDPGELVLVTGHSGSGKTTLMRLLTKEYTPNKGEIYFDNQNLSDIKKNRLHEHRRKIGVVFQDYRLVPEMNVWENIALPLAIMGKRQHEIEERVTDLLKLVQLPEKAYLFPSQLSGGEAQRISIARALANAPQIIFADEPTGNLDQDTSQSIAHLLKQINELGTTLIFATHDPKVLAIFADKRHIQLKDGEIAFDSAEKAGKDEKKPTSTKTTEPATSEEKVASKTTAKEDAIDKSSDRSTEKPRTTDDTQKETDEASPVVTTEKKESVSIWSKLFGAKKTTPSENQASNSATTPDKIVENKDKEAKPAEKTQIASEENEEDSTTEEIATSKPAEASSQQQNKKSTKATKTQKSTTKPKK